MNRFKVKLVDETITPYDLMAILKLVYLGILEKRHGIHFIKTIFENKYLLEWLWVDTFMVEMVKVDEDGGKKPDEKNSKKNKAKISLSFN
jgi:hypothetical protein